MQGFLDFKDRFDSCITATLTLFLSSTTPSSVCLLPIPLALSCRTLNVLSSQSCLEDGAGAGGGEGGDGSDSWSRGRRSNLLISGTFRIDPSRTSIALVHTRQVYFFQLKNFIKENSTKKRHKI